MTPISERQRACFCTYKNQSKKNDTYIYIFKKTDTFPKASKLNYIFIHKNPDTLRHAIFRIF